MKDNQPEPVFEGGKVIIPPLIHDCGRIWELNNGTPAEVRDGRVPRAEGAKVPATGFARKVASTGYFLYRLKFDTFCGHWN